MKALDNINFIPCRFNIYLYINIINFKFKLIYIIFFYNETKLFTTGYII